MSSISILSTHLLLSEREIKELDLALFVPVYFTLYIPESPSQIEGTLTNTDRDGKRRPDGGVGTLPSRLDLQLMENEESRFVFDRTIDVYKLQHL